MYDEDNKTAFSNEGFRVRRMNPDASYPAVDRQIGFLGTVDTTSLLATDVLSYRWNGVGAFTDIICDLTGAGVVPAATTVAEIVTALNLIAGFSAQFLASADSSTGRLKIANAVAVTGKTYLELKGTIATALGFGASGSATAVGTAFVTCFDDAAAVGLPQITKDGEQIEYETSKGSTGIMMIDALNRGYSPSLAMTDEVYELIVCIEGGVYDQTTHEYTRRTSDQPNAPQCYLEVFVGKYNDGAVHRGDAVAYKMYKISRMTGMRADISHEVKSWASYQFDCMAMEYIDVLDGIKKNACVEKELSPLEAEVLGVGVVA